MKRIETSKGMGAISGASFLAFVFLLAGGASAEEASGASAAEAGQKAFEANKCSNCHSIEKVSLERKIKSEKMAGPDLSVVGDVHDAEWITKFSMREVKLEDKEHKSEYKGTKKDLEVISTWLACLKSVEEKEK
jgi:cytochrome c2